MMEPLQAAPPTPEAFSETLSRRSEEIFHEQLDVVRRDTDRVFAGLMILQWFFGIALALWVSPRAWEGPASEVHIHVWAAILLGGALSVLPIYLTLRHPGRLEARHITAVAQMLWSALLIHLTGGRIETHFHVFGSLAFLAFYRDWRVLMSASTIVALDHLLRGIYWPESVYGYALASQWRWLEHSGWVVFEDLFLIRACLRGIDEMRATARHRARLEMNNVVIEDTVRTRTAELIAVGEQLRIAMQGAQAASLAKGRFLANMSHEIRTPMNAILGMTRLVLESDLQHEQREQLQIARHSAEALLKILNDVLDFSKAEAGKLELEKIPFSPAHLVSGVTKAFVLQAQQCSLKLEMHVAPDLPRWVAGDPGRVRQVLINLIGNALKFTRRGSVEVRAEVDALRDTEVSIAFSVRDTGVGIAPEKLGLIFESFEQGDASTTRRHGGTGLGLAIAAHLVELMDSRIDVTSEPGKGSVFRFTVAFDRCEAPEVAEAAKLGEAPAPTGRPLRVLLAEDNAVNRKLAVYQFEKLGHTVRSAADGLEALRLLEQERFDVVFADVQMPEMDGLELTAAIRERELATGRHLPVIALTSHAMSGDREEFLAAGMDDYVSKPFERKDLARVLERIRPLIEPEPEHEEASSVLD